MFFHGDSADLSEHVHRASAEASFLASPSLSQQSSSSNEGQPGRRFLGKNQSQQTAELISKTKNWPRKQGIMDAYMDKKIAVTDTPDVNAARLTEKLEKLSLHPALAVEDSKYVLERGQQYVQHMRPLCHQKLKRSSSSAARVAYEAEHKYDPQDGLCIILHYMRDALHEQQGPCARQGAMRGACNDVLAALAFPQPAEWQAEINSFVARGVQASRVHPPGFQCKKTASKLNAAQSSQASNIAKKYFYDKIVTHWNVGANCGHLQDKLENLLPLLNNSATLTEVQIAAKACQHQMEALRCQKKASEAHRRQMRRKLPASG